MNLVQSIRDKLSGVASERKGLEPEEQELLDITEAVANHPEAVEWSTAAQALDEADLSKGGSLIRRAYVEEHGLEIDFLHAASPGKEVHQIKVSAGEQVALELKDSPLSKSPLAKQLVARLMEHPESDLPSRDLERAQERLSEVKRHIDLGRPIAEEAEARARTRELMKALMDRKARKDAGQPV